MTGARQERSDDLPSETRGDSALFVILAVLTTTLILVLMIASWWEDSTASTMSRHRSSDPVSRDTRPRRCASL